MTMGTGGIFGNPMARKRGVFGMPIEEPLPQMGGPLDVPNTPQPEMKRKGLFGGGELNINPKLAALSQIFSRLGGSQDVNPIFALAMQQQQERARAQQAEAERATSWEDWQKRFDYERQFAQPKVNDTVEDFNWYKNLSDEDKALYHKMRPVYRQGPDGQFYAVDVGQPSTQAPPTFTDDDWNTGTPLGGQPGGTPPFGGKVVGNLDRITMMAESGGNPNAISPKGARGLMQVMPGTARDPGFGIRPSNGTPADDVRVGKEYRAAMQKRYGGDLAKMWAAYNWGPGNVDKAIADHGDNWFNTAPAETRSYIARNLRAARGQ